MGHHRVTVAFGCYLCSVRQGKAFLVRPPDGICGLGSSTTSPTWPAKVYMTSSGYEAAVAPGM